MLKTKREKKQFLLFFGGGLALAALIFIIILIRQQLAPSKGAEPVWGVTFSKFYAESLGLDWRKTFIASLDELKIRTFRIPVYWNDVEPFPKNYHFEDYDWMLSEAEKRGAKVLLGIGRKLPRWPECHIPDWAQKLTLESQELKLLGLIQTEVKHFANFAAVTAWQVENEALFKFGLCPKHPPELLEKEAAIVRGLDSRPIVITDSGELSSWKRAAEIGDILGISMYRLAWNQVFGYFYYPIPPAYYIKKAEAVDRYVDGVIVTELQAEPWGRTLIERMSLEEQYQSMNLERFRSNVDFARRTKFGQVYLWGVEWWYWLKEKHGNAEFWEEAKKLFK